MKVQKSKNHVIDVDDISDTIDMLDNARPSKEYLDKKMGSEDGDFYEPKGTFRTATFTLRPHLDRELADYGYDEFLPGSPIPIQPMNSDGALFEELMNKFVSDDKRFVLREGYPKEHWGTNGTLYVTVQWFETTPKQKRKVDSKQKGQPTTVGQAFS